MPNLIKILIPIAYAIAGLIAGLTAQRLAPVLEASYLHAYEGKPLPSVSNLALDGARVFLWWYLPIVAAILYPFFRRKPLDTQSVVSVSLAFNTLFLFLTWLFLSALLAPFLSFSLVFEK